MIEQRDLFSHVIDSPKIPGASHARFSGADYVPERDKKRLTGQLEAIYKLMKDGVWRSVDEIHEQTGKRFPHNSIQGNLRNLRKPSFGSYNVERRRRGDTNLSEYRVKDASTN